VARASTATTAARGRGSKKSASKGGFTKLFKLLLLMGGAAAFGFVVVFALDVGSSAVGKLRFGETTVSQLFGKVLDRVLDRDVPTKNGDEVRGTKKKSEPPPVVRDLQRDDSLKSAERRAATPEPREPTPRDQVVRALPRKDDKPRADLPAGIPDDYVKHGKRRDEVAASTDPQVERAKKRLDDLLGRL
jgi:hypothetical protein